MKLIKTFLVCLLVVVGLTSCAASGVATTSKQNYQNYDEVNYQVFYDELSPYGRWIMDDQYGYVWSPNEGPEFMPYRSNGHWVYTDIGWTWASDYNWGWATFHYGRWKLDNYYGWVWIPGYEWAPAWVAWSSSPDYYGWAPLEPGWNVNVSINIGRIPSNYWVFVPHQYITYSSWNRYSAPSYHNVTIIRNVTVINNTNIYHNTRFVCGPRPDEYRRYTGYAIRPVAVRESSRPRPVSVQEGSLYVYRPRVNAIPGNARPSTTVIRPRPGSEAANSRPYYPGNGRGYDDRSRPGYDRTDNPSNDNRRPDNNSNGRYTDRSNPSERPGNDRVIEPGNRQRPYYPNDDRARGQQADNRQGPQRNPNDDRANNQPTDTRQRPQPNPNTGNDAPNVDRPSQAERPTYNRDSRPAYTPNESQSNERPRRERQSEPTIQRASNTEPSSAPSHERRERSRSDNNNGSSNELNGRPRSRS